MIRYLCVYALTLFISLRGRCNSTYYGETCRHFKVRVAEDSGILLLMKKRSKSKKWTVVKDHMLICDQPVSFDDFKVLPSSNSGLHLKIKESLLITRDQPIFNKNEASLPFLPSIWLVSYSLMTSFIIHTLLFTFCCFQKSK